MKKEESMELDNSSKLGISIIVDVIGFSSYLIPFLGDLSDLIYAPMQAIWVAYAYKSVPGAIVSLVEEGLPFTDIIPTATIVHLIATRKKKSARKTPKSAK